MKKTPRKKPYLHAPAFTRKEIARLRGLAMKASTNRYSPVFSVSHITPRAYCVAKAAPLCAVFAVPLCDNEPQVRNSGFTTVHGPSCADVQTGDWCSIAYASTSTCGQPIVLENHTRL